MTRTRQQSAELKRRIVEEVRAGKKTYVDIAGHFDVTNVYVSQLAIRAGIRRGRVGRPPCKSNK